MATGIEDNKMVGALSWMGNFYKRRAYLKYKRIKILSQIKHLQISYYFSVTLLGDEHFGQMTSDGNYDGIFGALQRNETDVTLTNMPMSSLDARYPSPVIPGPFNDQWLTRILALAESTGRTKSVDLEESVLIIKQPAILLYSLLFIAIYQLAGRVCEKFLKTSNSSQQLASKSRLIWDLIRIICRQPISFMPYKSYARQGFIFNFSVALMWLFLLYNNLFSTDLTIEDPLIIMDTLEQVLHSKWTPGFEGASSMYQHFKKAPNGTMEYELWQRSATELPNGTNLLSGLDVGNIFNILRNRQMALIGPDMPLSIGKAIGCNFEKEDISKTPMVFSKSAFLPWYHGAAHSPYSTAEIRARVDHA